MLNCSTWYTLICITAGNYSVIIYNVTVLYYNIMLLD